MDEVHKINGDQAPYLDNTANPDFIPGDLPQQQQPFFRQLHDVAQLNQPAIQTFSENYRKIADEYDGDRFLMGEVDGDKGRAMEVSKTFTDTGRLHATYNFDLLAWGGLNVDGLRDAINNAVDVFNGSGRLCLPFQTMTFHARQHANLLHWVLVLTKAMQCNFAAKTGNLFDRFKLCLSGRGTWP